MKKSFIIYLVVIVCNLKAQFISYPVSFLKEDILNKTLVYKSGNEAYDSVMEKSMKEIWKINEYEILPLNDLGKIRKSMKTMKKYNFLLFQGYDENYVSDDSIIGNTTNVAYCNGRSLFTFDDNTYRLPNSEYSKYDYISNCNIGSMKNSYSKNDIINAIPFILFNLQYPIKLAIEENMEGKTLAKIQTNFSKIVSKYPCILKEKILLIEDNLSNKEKIEKIKSDYRYKYEICDREKILKALVDRNSEYTLLLGYVFYDVATYTPILFNKYNKTWIIDIHEAIEQENCSTEIKSLF